jgi:hypothetical protein
MRDNSEIDKWNRAASGEINVRGEFFHEVQDLKRCFTDNKDILPIKTDAKVNVGQAYYVTPQVWTFHGTGYFMKPVNRKRDVLFHERDRDHILALITLPEDQGGTPLAVKLDVETGIASDYDGGKIDLEHKTDFEYCLRNATSGLPGRLDQLRKEKAAQKQRRWFRGGLVVAASALLAAGTGGTYYVFDSKEKAERIEDARISAFDKQDVQLPGETVEVSSVELSKVPDSQFEQIPKYQKRDSLSSPRRMELDEDDCKKLDTPIADQVEVAVSVKRTEQFQEAPISFSRSPEGKLIACSMSEFGTKDDNKISIAVQVR